MAPGIARRTAWLVLVLALLSGCGEGVRYHGIDISGAEWGRDFALQDPEGQTRTLADFRGKVVMLFFGFVLCPDVCPTSLLRAKDVKRLLGPEGDRLQVLFVTVDPERDSAALLREYTAAFDPGFLGLRADLEATRKAAAEFRVTYEKVATGASYTVNHTALTYVFDDRGRLRLALRHPQTAEEVAADLRTLMHSSAK